MKHLTRLARAGAVVAMVTTIAAALWPSAAHADGNAKDQLGTTTTVKTFDSNPIKK